MPRGGHFGSLWCGGFQLVDFCPRGGQVACSTAYARLMRIFGSSGVLANLVEGEKVAVHDPDHRLPHDQSSWS
jgi:hypothetical protein